MERVRVKTFNSPNLIIFSPQVYLKNCASNSLRSRRENAWFAAVILVLVDQFILLLHRQIFTRVPVGIF